MRLQQHLSESHKRGGGAALCGYGGEQLHFPRARMWPASWSTTALHVSLKSRTVLNKADAKIIFASLGRLHSRTWIICFSKDTTPAESETIQTSLRFLGRSRLMGYLASFLYEKRFLPGAMKGCFSGLQHVPECLRRMLLTEAPDAFRHVRKRTLGYMPDTPDSELLGQLPNPHVITHGDFRADHAFIDDTTKTARFIDWSLCMCWHPLQDFVWCLIDLDPSLVGDKAQMTHLMQVYVDAVNGGDEGFDNETTVSKRAPSMPRTTVEALMADLPVALANQAYFYMALAMSVKEPRGQMYELGCMFVRRLDALMETFGYEVSPRSKAD